MKKLKNMIGRMIGKMSVFIALSAVFLSPWDGNCVFIIGETDIPDSLLKLIEVKYKILYDSNNMR